MCACPVAYLLVYVVFGCAHVVCVSVGRLVGRALACLFERCMVGKFARMIECVVV